MSTQKLRKSDRKEEINSPAELIPITIHYNDNTLLTKNGELIQIIKISGINADYINPGLSNLRTRIIDAIKKNFPNKENFAFWFHTVRSRVNLDDNLGYAKLLPANIHHMWAKKNHLDNKYINTLYVSIVFSSSKLEVKNVSSFINSFFSKIVTNFESQYLANACAKLTDAVNKFLSDLDEFVIQKLGVVNENNENYSDLLFLYRKILYLDEEREHIPITDLSSYLSEKQYIIGPEIIEVTKEDESTKYVSILGIKEYQETLPASLDNFLQIPLELIITEIIYFVNKQLVVPEFKHQKYILNISGDKKLATSKGLTAIIDSNVGEIFCKQHISVAIISQTAGKIQQEVEMASRSLLALGIIHVKENINLEAAFWAQLPGNFHYIKRTCSTILKNAAAFVSLYNSSIGEQYNRWGRAVTILRSEKGRPYFMNFYNKANRGNTGIFGGLKSGKTVLTNFLLSEATKFDPSILYLSNNTDSKILIEGLEGTWIDADKKIINPFLLDDNLENKIFVYEFLKVICNHYIVPLLPEELIILNNLVLNIFSLDFEDRKLSYIIANNQYFENGGENIQKILSIFGEEGKYYQIFDAEEEFSLNSQEVVGFNIYKYSDEYFTKQYFPENRKYISVFNEDFLINLSIRNAIIYALTFFHNKSDDNPKILAIDNILSLIEIKYFKDITTDIYYNMINNNGIVLSNFNLTKFLEYDSNCCEAWLKLLDTIIVLPNIASIDNLTEKLKLHKADIEKLKSITAKSRIFLIKQDDVTTLVEVSISTLIGVVRILSAKSEELEIYDSVRKEYPGDANQWIGPLHNVLEEN